jgi:putative sporulation protein YyaC
MELSLHKNKYENIAIVCIGSDRATGDCLGPIVGDILNLAFLYKPNIKVYGTLKNTIHAKNIDKSLTDIYKTTKNPLVIAIDACLGSLENVGKLNVSNKPLSPGSALEKQLQAVGDITIIAVVNHFTGTDDVTILRNTNLNVVTEMSNVIIFAIICGILKLEDAVLLDE